MEVDVIVLVCLVVDEVVVEVWVLVVLLVDVDSKKMEKRTELVDGRECGLWLTVTK